MSIMAATSFSEEKSLDVYWKIKNFSFCYENIKSPQFDIDGNTYTLSIKDYSDYFQYNVFLSNPERDCHLDREISVLSCDDSPEISKSGSYNTYLRVPKDSIFSKKRSSFLPEDTLTVRYRFPKSWFKGEIYFGSEIGVKRKYFMWNHPNLSSFRYSDFEEEWVEGSESYGDIILTLKSTEGFNTGNHLFIEISRMSGERCYYILKVSMMGLGGIALNEVSHEFMFEKKYDQQTKVFLPFKMNELLAGENLLLPKETLSLKCNLASSLGSLADQTSFTCFSADFLSVVRESGEKSNWTVANLKADLKSILDDGTLFDATLQVGDEKIKAHKTILSARSSVFRAMFTKDMKEKIDSNVVIEDLDVETVRMLLVYMYTDSICDEQWENVKKLYFAADKYEVMGLKNKCGSFLKTNISVSNVCEALVLADLHQDDCLKMVALDFVSKNDCAVFTSEGWKELVEHHSTVVVQAMREIYRKK